MPVGFSRRDIYAADLLVLKQHLLNISEIESGLIEFSDKNDNGVIGGVDLNIMIIIIISI